MNQRSERHWSASQFMLYEECPQKYKARYIDGVVSPPSLAMLFGHCVHTALEALLQGPGGTCPVTGHADHSTLDCAYDVYWREFSTMRRILDDEGIEASGLLYLDGLRMIDQVDALKLNADGRSASERWFRLIHEPLVYPVIGAVDLWSPPYSQHGAVVWDFKTTVGRWSQERAEREQWQPLLYAWAYAREYDVVPEFRYVVLNRTSGELSQFTRSWSSRRELRRDLEHLQFVMEEIAEAVLDGNFTCTRGHGSCLECGEPYGHGHVCRDALRKATIRLTRNGPAVDLVQTS